MVFIALNFCNWSKAVRMGWIYRKRIYIFGKWTPFILGYLDIGFKIRGLAERVWEKIVERQ